MMNRTKIIMLGGPFMLPSWNPEADVVFVDLDDNAESKVAENKDAAFALACNTACDGPTWERVVRARDVAKQAGVPTVWHTIEDPNSFGTFVHQADGFDVIATSDGALIPEYQSRYPRGKVIWLPMAAQPAIHFPVAAFGPQADFVLAANYYTNDARQAAIHDLIEPLIEAGHSLALYAYDRCRWPDHFDRFYRGDFYYTDTASHYKDGVVALALNNQAWGTAMCSMRTFEVLACGKPTLSYYSSAYKQLGFINAGPDLEEDGHFVWVDNRKDALTAARNLLDSPRRAAEIAAKGMHFVLQRHTYRNRLSTIMEALR
jgi:Glycosyl transferases group 1